MFMTANQIVTRLLSTLRNQSVAWIQPCYKSIVSHSEAYNPVVEFSSASIAQSYNRSSAGQNRSNIQIFGTQKIVENYT